jgi:hypothetical protein
LEDLFNLFLMAMYLYGNRRSSDIRLSEVSKEPQIAALLVATTALQPTTAINQTHIHVLEVGRGG